MLGMLGFLEAQPGVEPGYETVPRPCVAIPPPGHLQSVAQSERASGYNVKKWLACYSGFR